MQVKSGAEENGNSAYVPHSQAAAAAASLFSDQGGLLKTLHQSLHGDSLDMDVRALMMAREREKQKIREDILEGAILRRRELEAEVIAEMRMERDLLNRRRAAAGEGLSLLHNQMLPEVMEAPLRDRLGIDGSSSVLSRPEAAMTTAASRAEGGGVLGAFPFQRQPGAATAFAGVKPNNEAVGKGQVIPLVKPTTNAPSSVAPVKRKAETLITESDNAPPPANGNKKLKKEYKCTLCQVTATSEQGLLEHLKGKKHKSKEKALSKSTTSASDDADQSQAMVEGTGNSSEQILSASNGKPKQKKDLDGKLDGVSDMEIGDYKVTNGDEAEESEQEIPIELSGNYKYWCVVCNIGTPSESKMDGHKAGKKHRDTLMKNGGGVVAVKTMPDDAQYINGNKKDAETEEALGDAVDEADSSIRRDAVDQKETATVDQKSVAAGDDNNAQKETALNGGDDHGETARNADNVEETGGDGDNEKEITTVDGDKQKSAAGDNGAADQNETAVNAINKEETVGNA